METAPAESPGGPSKADTLRGVVTERLAAASREILAAVERTVAAYEAEASGFRREIIRQKRQLELLQPPVTGSQTSRNQGSAEEEDGEDEESHRPLKTLDLIGPSSSSSLRCRSARRKTGRPQISRIQNTINLRVHILEDSSISVVSKTVMKKSPMVPLKCPRGLQEADFLDLLRSAVPQLAGDDKHFELLTSDKRWRLQPLTLQTVTPEEIQRSSGPGRSTVYVRLKTQTEAQEEIHPPQTERSSDMETCDDTRLRSSHVQEVSRSTSPPQAMKTDDDGGGFPQPEEYVAPSAAGSDSEAFDENESDSSWKPDEKDKKKKKKDSKEHQKISEETKKCSDVTQTESSGDPFTCKVCGSELTSEDLLVQHAWSHQEEVEGVCGVCGESVEVLMDHFQSEHRTEVCPVCGEFFIGVFSLNEHVAAHSGEKPHRCEVCHSVFALKVSLEDHQKLHEPAHKCPTCHKVFKLEIELKAHRRTHHKRKAFLCGVCGKFLSDSRSLTRHKVTHSGERPHRCQICERGFKLPTTLRQHEKIHTNRERSYLCDICCKMFLTSKQLVIHMRSHTNEKPFHCDECGKGFTTKGPLKIHMRVHTGETPYRCSYCGWSFKRKSNLDDHVATHTGEKPHVCGICGKRCARKTYLNVHMRTHNGERPYKCTICEKAFTQSHCLKTHMRSHEAAQTVGKIS